MGEKDIVEKILLAYNDVFADILNGLLFHGEQKVQSQELSEAAPRSYYKADGKNREMERDVVKRWDRDYIRIASFGLENQTEADPDMPLRIYGYDGAEYTFQCSRENKGKPRYPSVTVVLYFGYKKHWDKPTTLHEAVQVRDDLKPYVNDLKINLFEVAFMNRKELEYFHSDFKYFADYFIQMRETGTYVPSPASLDHIEAFLRALSVFTNDHRFEDVLNEDYVEEGGPKNMCDVLDKIEERGIEKGRAEGIELNRLESIKTVMKKLKYTAQQAMDFLDIPSADQPKFLAML